MVFYFQGKGFQLVLQVLIYILNYRINGFQSLFSQLGYQKKKKF